RREFRQESSASRETSRVRDPAFTGVQSQKCVDGFRSLGLGDDDDRIELVRPRQHHELDPGNAQRLLHDREILISHDASIVAAFGCQYRLRLALSERPLPPVLTVAQLGNGDLLSRRCLFSTPAPDPFPEPHHYSVPPLATAFFEMPKLILHSSTTFIGNSQIVSDNIDSVPSHQARCSLTHVGQVVIQTAGALRRMVESASQPQDECHSLLRWRFHCPPMY